jgi:amino acid permease
MRRFVDSFKLEPSPVPVTAVSAPPSEEHIKGSEYEKAIDPEKGTVGGVIPTTADGVRLTSDESGLKRNLTQRHMQMIAFGGSIGTGLL